jgi:hypothetical protein
MCGLCGALGQVDWTDRAATTALAAEPTYRLQAERQRMAGLVSAILAGEGLSLKAWGANGFILRSKTGKQAVVPSLLQVWQAAEDMLGRPVDPLAAHTMQAAAEA